MEEIATIFASLKDTEEEKFFLAISPSSALNAGSTNKYYGILTDFNFISLKINHPNFGVEALIRDYDLIDDPEILENLDEEEKLNPEQVKTLKLIQRTLQLSAHVLNQDPSQLVGQLWGRLQGFIQSEIQQILADAQQSKSENHRFRPITASLTPPGGNLLSTLTGHNKSVKAVAITPDGQKALSASDDDTLKLWDLETGKILSTFTGHNRSVQAVAITPDGKKALSASSDNTLKLWDLQTGENISTFIDPKYWTIRCLIFLVQTIIVYLTFLLFKSYLFISICLGFVFFIVCLVALYYLNNKSRNNAISTIAISTHAKKAISSSSDNTLKLSNLDTETILHTLKNKNRLVRAVAITPDGTKILSSADDDSLKLWDLETGKKLSTLTGHNRPVTAVAITPDGTKALSGSQDKTLKLWDLDTREELSTLTAHNKSVHGVVITTDGTKALSGSWDKTLKLWDL